MGHTLLATSERTSSERGQLHLYIAFGQVRRPAAYRWPQQPVPDIKGLANTSQHPWSSTTHLQLVGGACAQVLDERRVGSLLRRLLIDLGEDGRQLRGGDTQLGAQGRRRRRQPRL